MKPTLQPVLSLKNIHERDQYIQFFEEGHKYIISFEPEVKYTSVTTWNHTHFPKFDADAIFIKQWVPELTKVLPRDIHKWYIAHTLEKYSDIHYDKPIVVYDEQKQKMLSMYEKAL